MNNFLSREQQGLLRIWSINPQLLTPNERIEASFIHSDLLNNRDHGPSIISRNYRSPKIVKESNVKSTDVFKANQDLEYYTSLLQDQTNSLLLFRESERKAITELFKSRIPEVPKIAENSLTLDEQRLLRVYSLRPDVLTQEEKNEALILRSKLSRLSSGCLNLSEEQERKLINNNLLIVITLNNNTEIYIPYKLGADLYNNILIKGLVNDSMNLVDVMIPINEEYLRYPLTKEESEDVLGKIRILGFDPDNYPRLKFKEIEDTLSSIKRIKRDIK